MMKNKLIALVLLVATIISTSVTSFVIAEPISVHVMAPARAMAVIEGNTNTLLYGHNHTTKLPMASTTKITTAIVAIENCKDLDEIFAVSDKAVGIEGTSIYLNKDEQISMRELLYGLMLASGNDCAMAIAERLGGVESFMQLMNDFVLKIGAINTHYDNPHGLDSDTHYTTAHDLALITSYALKNDVFREISATTQTQAKSTSKTAKTDPTQTRNEDITEE